MHTYGLKVVPPPLENFLGGRGRGVGGSVPPPSIFQNMGFCNHHGKICLTTPGLKVVPPLENFLDLRKACSMCIYHFSYMLSDGL